MSVPMWIARIMAEDRGRTGEYSTSPRAEMLESENPISNEGLKLV